MDSRSEKGPGTGEPGKTEDPRFADLVQSAVDETTDVVILGFPCDEGVRRNGGRVGAATGPAAIRNALSRMTPDARNPDASGRLLERTCDLGDIDVTGDLERDQAALGRAVGEQLAARRRVVVLGGGHETAYGHFLGYVAAGLLPVSILNLDAHPDVRPLLAGKSGGRVLGHSGSPFRQALDHGGGASVSSYQVAGLQRASVAAAHLEYLRSKQSRYEWADDITEASLSGAVGSLIEPSMVTLDLDVVDAAFAPGVSAPAAGGLTSRALVAAAELAGRSSSVRSLEVVELNPSFDVDGRTARLAALAVWRFLAGAASPS